MQDEKKPGPVLTAEQIKTKNTSRGTFSCNKLISHSHSQRMTQVKHTHQISMYFGKQSSIGGLN